MKQLMNQVVSLIFMHHSPSLYQSQYIISLHSIAGDDITPALWFSSSGCSFGEVGLGHCNYSLTIP